MRHPLPFPRWTAIVLLALAPAAQAHRDMPPPPPEHCQAPPPDAPPRGMEFPPPPPFPHRLKLDEAQLDQVFSIQHAQAPRLRAATKAARAALDELRRLGAGDRFDMVRARQLAAAHGQASAELALTRAETDAKLRALLTPEQRALLDAEPANPAETRRRRDAE